MMAQFTTQQPPLFDCDTEAYHELSEFHYGLSVSPSVLIIKKEFLLCQAKFR